MKIRKTKWSERGIYRYPRYVDDNRGGYRLTYEVIRPGEDGVTGELIRMLHYLDDSEVYNNLKNSHPPLTKEQRAEKKEWEKEHPGETYSAGWTMSLDYLIWDGHDGSVEKGHLYLETSANPFEDIPDDVALLRWIVENEMTEKQRQAYNLIGLQGYKVTEAAALTGVSVNTASIHYKKAIECIRDNFKKFQAGE